MKTLEHIPLIPLAQFELDPVQTRLRPPYSIARDVRRITVTVEETFTVTCLDALRAALHQAAGPETEVLMFEGAPAGGRLRMSTAAFRELAGEFAVEAFLKIRGRLVRLSGSSG